MFQIVAENASLQTLRRILSHLTLDMQISLVCYAFKHYREGSYYILKELKEVHAMMPAQKRINCSSGL